MNINWPDLNQTLFGKPAQVFVEAIGIFLVSMVVLICIEKLLITRLKRIATRTTNDVDDFLIDVFHKTLYPLTYIFSLFLSLQHLNFSSQVLETLMSLIKIAVIIQLVRFVLGVTLYTLKKTWLKNEPSEGTAARSILTLLRFAVWAVAIVFILDNLGFDVNSVVAGLGIGGVAVALAAQTILGDLFNYFVIFFDKPFKVGDFIIIGEHMGVIQHIGIKSTRIRSLSGEQLIFSNSDLTSSRIRNYKRMTERRVLFKLGVVYQTTKSQMEKIPVMIKDIVEAIEGVRFDRAHFSSFADFSLQIEVVYYVLNPDYNRYMDLQQTINFKIMEKFESEGIEFAYPTQTLFVQKDAN